MIIPVKTELGAYDVVIEKNCTEQADRYLSLSRKVLIVTDDGVPADYARRIASFCKYPKIVTVNRGEDSKSIKNYEMLLSYMLENGFTRSDAVIAVGGGMVGDLSGFVAASYMRGIDFYNVPTTVLAQVDASVGGKTALNLLGIKNIVGAFYQPKKVLIDTELLKTLDKRQLSNGLAEALKMAICFDEKLFSLFESVNVFSKLDEVIERSVMIKKSVVERDERESGIRRALNFGHTIGHGIESTTELYHGECVALGMLPMCSDKVRARLVPVLEKLALPTECDFDSKRVYEAAVCDKKASSDGVFAVTAEEIGAYKITKISFEELFELINNFGSDRR